MPKNVLEEMLREAGYGKKETSAVFEIAELRGSDKVFGVAGEVAEPLSHAIRALQAMGLGEFVTVDLTIVRGLAYYTGIVWELFDTQKQLPASEMRADEAPDGNRHGYRPSTMAEAPASRSVIL